MSINEWYYLPVAALVNSIFQFFWTTKVARKKVTGAKILGLIFLSSLLNAWGIDVIQKIFDIFAFIHIMKVSLGCWLMFAVASASKHYAVNGWSKKNFWLDYGGDLVGYLLMGIIIYVLT